MIETPNFGRLRWHSRRGMLELDLVFERFWARHGETLTAAQATQLEQILLLEEGDLWETLCGRRELANPQVKDMLELLRER